MTANVKKVEEDKRKTFFEIGDKVRSLLDRKIVGDVIGYGTLTWFPEDEPPSLVYLVRVRKEGSGVQGPAVAVLRADRVEGA